MTGADIVTAINGSASVIDLDNLAASVGTAVTNSHIHNNKSTLNNITAAFTTAMDTKLSGIEALADVTDATNVGTSIYGSTAKTTMVAADQLAIIDSEAANILKKITFANLKTALGVNLTLTALTTGFSSVPFPVPMRIKPSSIEHDGLHITDYVNYYAVTGTGLDGALNSTFQASIYATVAQGLTQYRPYVFTLLGSSAGYLAFNAEL